MIELEVSYLNIICIVIGSLGLLNISFSLGRLFEVKKSIKCIQKANEKIKQDIIKLRNGEI